MSMSILRCGLLACALALGLAVEVLAQQPANQAAKGQAFTTAEAAANALTEALRGDDDTAVSAILGPSWRDFVPASKEDEDRARARYLAGWDANHKVVVIDESKAVIEAGTTGWTMPIPIVKDGAEWRFDREAAAKKWWRAASAATSWPSSRRCWRSSTPSASTPRSIR